MTLNLRTPLTCVAVALAVLTASPGEAQTAPNDAATMPGMAAHMMADHQQMMGKAAAQKKLDDLVAAMNQAAGADKVNQLAAVVTELVAQHREMCARMMSGNMMTQSPTAKPTDDHATHHPEP